jgi:ankyrin repeat protein
MKKRSVLWAIAVCVSLVVAFIVAVVLHGAWVLQDTPLMRAVGKDDVQKVKLLLDKGADINEHSRLLTQWTPLIAAVYANQTNMVRYLIEAGANVHLAGSDGKTPLIWAAQFGDQDVPIVKELITHGARLDAKDKFGATAYDYAKSAPPKPELLAILETAKREQETKSHKK